MTCNGARALAGISLARAGVHKVQHVKQIGKVDSCRDLLEDLALVELASVLVGSLPLEVLCN